MSENMNLQEAILKECIREKVPLTLFLMNGFQLRGIVTGFDSFVVVLVSDGKQHHEAVKTCDDPAELETIHEEKRQRDFLPDALLQNGFL